jgi:hypothetical protein
MDSNQPTTTATTTTTIPPQGPAPVSGGMYASKMPSTVAFAVAVLLFLMPFVDIKCNDMSLQQVRGFELATGFEMKKTSGSNSYLDDIKTDKVDDEITKATTNTGKKDPNLFAMVALGLGVLGLILSFVNSKGAAGGGMVTGLAGAGALIGLMLDVKKKVKLDMPDLTGKTGDNKVGETIDKIGDKMSEVTDNMKITVDFTPWFYIAVVAFLVAAFFCYRRMAARK